MLMVPSLVRKKKRRFSLCYSKIKASMNKIFTVIKIKLSMMSLKTQAGPYSGGTAVLLADGGWGWGWGR